MKIENDELIKKNNDIEKELELLDGVVKSFQQRKNALEDTIKLYIFGYNGEVKQGKDKDEVKNRIINKLNN